MRESLVIGDHKIIRPFAEIAGRSVEIGHSFFMDSYAYIGGGSCFDPMSKLVAGDYLHMGRYSHINTAREVVLGDEVGLGIGTKVFTHGAYLSALDGFPYKFAPVYIGSRVWLPNAIVNPGVTIGNDVVVLPMSVVAHDIPDGCLVGGIPAKTISREYPKSLSDEDKETLSAMIYQEAEQIQAYSGKDFESLLKNQRRRYGIR